MRRYVGGRHPQHDAAVERHRLAGRAHEIRRRDSRTGFARPPAEHRPRGRHGPQRGRRRTRRAGRHRLHARAGTARFAARGRVVRQRARPGARHPDGRGEPLAGTYPLALPRPARPDAAPPRLPVPLPARQRRTYADRAGGLAAGDGDRRHDDRRRRRQKRSTSVPK